MPHQPFRLATTCQQKRRFRSEKEALVVADYQMLITPGLELTVYTCETCGGWHLTRQVKHGNN
jgi:hypothetical protein